jgi:ABC-type sulfate/molybdate transport systems ATPase subunit
MVPEDDERQTELRRFLRRLRDRDGFTLLVSHDELALQQSGVPAWVAH